MNTSAVTPHAASNTAIFCNPDIISPYRALPVITMTRESRKQTSASDRLCPLTGAQQKMIICRARSAAQIHIAASSQALLTTDKNSARKTSFSFEKPAPVSATMRWLLHAIRLSAIRSADTKKHCDNRVQKTVLRTVMTA